MARLNGVSIDNNQTMRFRRGDSGFFYVDGIPVDRNYGVYFAIFDPETGEKASAELFVNSNNSQRVRFDLSVEFTTSLNGTEKGRRYTYGIKICFEDEEETVLPSVITENGRTFMQKAPDGVVYSEKAEGI